MGAGAERIAIDIQTSANTSGTSAATQGLNQVAQAQQKVAVTAQQMSAALAQSNGNLQQAARIAAQMAQQGASAATAAVPPAVTPGTVAGGAIGGGATLTGVGGTPPVTASGVAGVTAVNQQLALTPSRARTAANAIGIFANTAASGQFSVAGLASATGNLATAIATVSNVAKTVAVATWIGIIATIGAAVVGFVEKFMDKTKQANAQTKELESSIRGIRAGLADDKLTQSLEQIRSSTEKEVEAVRERYRFDILHRSEEEKLIALTRQRGALQEELAKHEVEFRLFNQKQEQAGQFNIAQAEREHSQFLIGDFTLRERQLEQETITRKTQLQLEYESRSLTAAARKYLDDLLKSEDAITEQKKEQIKAERQLAQAAEVRTKGAESGNLYDRTIAALAEIQHRKNEEIRATEDVVTATAVAEQRKRNLYRDTRLQAEANFKSLIDVIRESGSRQVHAIGTAMETFRRLVIGAEAAHSAVLAIKEGAAAIGSLAIGDFRGAALHGASALEYGKAAALAGAESLGGGPSGGGGAGGGAGGGTFVPNQGQNGGNQTIIIHVGDVSNPALVNTLIYEVNRSGLLNKPVIAPYGRPS